MRYFHTENDSYKKGSFCEIFGAKVLRLAPKNTHLCVKKNI